MQSPLEVLKEVVQLLEKGEIEHYLVGSLAAMYYGRPRFTNYIDLVVQIKASQISVFVQLFDIDDYYCPPQEIISDEVIRRGAFNLIHQKSGVKIDVILTKPTPFSECEMGRRQKVQILPGFEAFIATAEDIILKKLDFFREVGSEKHLLDIRSILSETAIDSQYLKEWIEKLGLQREWKLADQ